MGKKFSILKIDTNKLYEEILDFMALTGEAHPYLLMGKDTARALLESMNEHTLGVDGIYYKGYKIYLNADLAFGEIGIR